MNLGNPFNVLVVPLLSLSAKHNDKKHIYLFVDIIVNLLKHVRSQGREVFAFPDHLRRIVTLTHHFPEAALSDI